MTYGVGSQWSANFSPPKPTCLQNGLRCHDVDQFIERATQVIGETFYPDNFGLMLLDETHQALHHHPSYHRGSAEKPDFDVSLDRGITGFVARTGRSLRLVLHCDL